MREDFAHDGRQCDAVKIARVHPQTIKPVPTPELGAPDFDLEREMRETVFHESCTPLPFRGERRLRQRFVGAWKRLAPRSKRRLQHAGKEALLRPLYKQNGAARVAGNEGRSTLQRPRAFRTL